MLFVGFCSRCCSYRRVNDRDHLRLKLTDVLDHHFIFTRNHRDFLGSETGNALICFPGMHSRDADRIITTKDFLHAALTMHESAKTIHMMQPLGQL